MNDFLKMAQAAKSKSDDAITKRNEKDAADRRREQERMASAQLAIETDVIPILEQAKAAFAQEGIGMRIDYGKSFGGSPAAPVEVYYAAISCHNPELVNPQGWNGGTGGRVRFEHDGQRIRVTCDWQSHGSSALRHDEADPVSKGIGLALDNYLQVREKKGR